jgi:hypothetical protein
MMAFRTALSLVNGSVAVGVGGAILFVPESVFGRFGILDAASPDLLSELRAPGAALLAAGAFMLVSAWKRRLRRAASLLALLVYGSYAVGRLVSWTLDGMPSGALLAAMAVEVLLAALSLLALQRPADGFPAAGRGRWA